MIILGNIFGFLNGIFCTLSTFQKTKKKLLIMQCIDSTCGMIACILLNGISGAIISFCGLLRNLLCYKKELSKKTSLILAISIGTVAAILNNTGLIGIFPILADIEYTYILGIARNTKIIVIALIINNILWFIYDMIIFNYMGAIWCILIIICAIFNLIKNKDKQTI